MLVEPAATSRAPRLLRRPALDGLRGLAVVSVLLYHTGVLRGGWIGVDTFFVLSGYLITSLLIAEHDASGTIDLRTFWTRRARRLLPALFALLAGVALFGTLVASAESRVVIRQDLWGALTYSSNWLDVVRGTGYWQQFVQPSPLAHVWSLAIEEQFYIVWPLAALLVLRRGGVRRLVLVAGAGAATLAAWSLFLASTGASADRLYLGTDTRAPALLLGALLGALRVGDASPRLARVARAVAPAGLALLIGAALTLEGSDPAIYRGLLLGVSGAGAIAVIGACQSRAGWFGRALGWRPLATLGVLSYGIYLAHWPILLAVRAHWHLDPWQTTGVVSALTLAVAGASYVLLELPLRHGGLRAWRSPLLAPAVAFACALAAFAGTAGARPAFASADRQDLLRALPAAGADAPSTTLHSAPSSIAPAPPTTPAPGVASTAVTEPPVAASSVTEPPVAVAAPRPAGRAPRVLLVGDSVAYSLRSGLTEAARARGIDVAVRAAPGCTPEERRTAFKDGPDTKREPGVCTELVAQWSADVERFQPDVVVMVYGGATFGWLVDGQPADPCDPSYVQRYGELVDHATEVLSGAGASVAVALPAYNRVFGEIPKADTFTDCMRDTFTASVARHADKASLLRLDLLACPSQATCDPDLGGKRLRYDGLHYRDAAAVAVGGWILDQLIQPAA